MADVEGGLLKCVLQLAACSDKLRLADARLGKYVDGMKRDLPASELPSLKSKLAIVPAGTANEEDTPEQQFEKLYELGTEAAERLEVTKSRMEKELRRRSEHFRDLVSSRNMDIQEEYARMLKELEDQAEELKQDIEKERSAKEENRKRRRDEREQRKAQKKSRHESLAHDNAHAQEQLEAYTADIRQLQNLFAEMEEEDEQAKRREEENARTEQERLEHLEDQLGAEVSELRQEITMLRETRDSINAKLETTTLKSQYEEERDEVKAEISHLRDKLQELTSQLTSNGVRLHSLLRTLAPTPSIGTLMTRLFQQLSPDRRSSSGGSPSGRESTDSSSQVSLKTVGLQEFLHSCPTVEEGRKAINEMKKLQLIHYYESSGVIALAQ